MQTFLPYPDFRESARCLDKRRLWKQVIESRQLLNALAGVSGGWANHPALRMWRGHAPLLFVYHTEMLHESISRGIRVRKYLLNAVVLGTQYEWLAPRWLGDPAFHASHRSNLLRKDAGWYGRFGWSEPPDLPYVWPLP